MPIYNYNCPECGDIELQRKMTDAEITICPNCENKIIRIFSAVNNVWKCDGAYSKANHKE